MPGGYHRRTGYNRRRSDKTGNKFAIGEPIHGFTVFMEYSMQLAIIPNMLRFLGCLGVLLEPLLFLVLST